DPVAILARSELVRCRAGDKAGAAVNGKVEPEAIRQRHVTGLHRVADLRDGLDARALGDNAHPVAVADAELIRIGDADAQRPLGVALSPSRIAENGVGRERAPLSSRQ